MNNHPIVSGIAAANLIGKEQQTVTLRSTGIDLAGPTDRVIGVLLRGAYTGFGVDVALAFGHALHYATCGNNTAITQGDDLMQGTTPGSMVEKTAGGQTLALAWESFPANSPGGQFRCLFMKGNVTIPTYAPIFAGVHTWAGGSATTDNIALTGLLTTDIVVAHLAAAAASEALQVAVAAAGQINLTLTADGTNGTTKVNYVVFREL